MLLDLHLPLLPVTLQPGLCFRVERATSSVAVSPGG